MLDRNPETRMGSNGFSEVKAHSFYDGINWPLLTTKSMQPPIHLKQERVQSVEASPIDLLNDVETIGEEKKFRDYYEGFYYEKPS